MREPQRETARDKVLRFALDNEPVGLKIDEDTTLSDLHVLSAAYDMLLDIDHDLNIRPHLIARWEQESPTSYRMHLRDDVRFQDGTPLTAEGVKWSLEHLARPGSALESTLAIVDRIEVLGDYEFRMFLTEPYSPFLSLLASAPGLVFSPNVQEVPLPDGEVLRVPYGTGPFRILEKNESAFVLERNADYWDRDEDGLQLPYFDGLELPWLETGTDMLRSLEAGRLSMINEIPYSQVPLLRERSDLHFAFTASMSFNGIRLNCACAPFSDRRLRQAVAWGIDREAMLQEINLGVGYAMQGPIPPASWAYDPAFRPYRRNPEQVRALLAEAGYPDGFDFTIKIQSEAMKKMVGYMGAHLAECGIRMHMEVVTVHELVRALDEREFEAIFLGVVGGTDPDEILSQCFHSEGSGNHMSYGNETVDALLVQARQEADQERRIALYREAQQLIVEDSPFIFTRSGLSMIAKRPEIENAQPHPDMLMRWKHVRPARVAERVQE